MRQKNGVTEIGNETDTFVCSAKGYTDSQLLEFLIKLWIVREMRCIGISFRPLLIVAAYVKNLTFWLNIY